MTQNLYKKVTHVSNSVTFNIQRKSIAKHVASLFCNTTTHSTIMIMWFYTFYMFGFGGMGKILGKKNHVWLLLWLTCAIKGRFTQPAHSPVAIINDCDCRHFIHKLRRAGMKYAWHAQTRGTSFGRHVWLASWTMK